MTTLELDVQITEDGHAVVTYDRDPQSAQNARGHRARVPRRAEHPYVPDGRYIKDLTPAQVRTIDCGSHTLSEFPDQQASPGAPIAVGGLRPGH
ncbi:Glycerophosphoryl diester phosphodiesterase family protein [Blastococcus tunisiensis]|uniref:Glycerophosphoryl diester phosphodiesterase family protein n=1 Tax=Blastococcus tunisiensis TaxID=1798228 RepID=A0A1I2ELP9_9ACTN|nr:Glycerophosphoryl diester phosphodiesterase family protein [Blastococcus sp. DSM 46838]